MAEKGREHWNSCELGGALLLGYVQHCRFFSGSSGFFGYTVYEGLWLYGIFMLIYVHSVYHLVSYKGFG